MPPHASLVDSVANILNVSSDSAYRRIRGETPLVLDEARVLCQHFKLSLDQLLNVKDGSTLFQSVRLSSTKYNYEQYLKDLIMQVKHVGSFIHKEIIYRTKDMPVFHNFYFKPLIAFRYFFWMKSTIQHPDFANRDFELNCVSTEIEKLSRELTIEYNKVPSTEIWNTEGVNAAISQIEFYKDLGYFSSSNDIKTIYESLEQTFLHLKDEVEYGRKFMPGESPEAKKNNFKFFYNRVMLGETTIIVVTDRIKQIFLNYDALNYVTTRDETFCNPYYEDIQNLMKKSTLISETGEKQRNIFFGILMNKIKERRKKL